MQERTKNKEQRIITKVIQNVAVYVCILQSPSYKMTRKLSIDAMGRIVKEMVIVKKTSKGIGRLSPGYSQRRL